jgi:hypothetical protein
MKLEDKTNVRRARLTDIEMEPRVVLERLTIARGERVVLLITFATYWNLFTFKYTKK